MYDWWQVQSTKRHKEEIVPVLHKISIRFDLRVSFFLFQTTKLLSKLSTKFHTSLLTHFLSENNCTWEDFDDKCFAAADENEEENENIDEDEDEETDDNDTNIEVIFK